MWLLFGGSGFLGSAFRALFEDRGISFYAPDSSVCDIGDFEHVGQVVRKIEPEVVINCAAITGVDFCEQHHDIARRINAKGPENLAVVCRDTGAFLVHFSTDYVFSGEKKTPYLESDLPDPINFYGLTKYLSEKAVQRLCPDSSLIIRTAWLFSHQKKGFFTYLVRSLVSQTDLSVPVQIGSPTCLDDLAQTVMKLVEERRTGLYHVVNTGEVSWKELAMYFLKYLPSDRPIRVVESEGDRRIALRPPYSVLATDKLQREAEIAMRTWKEAAEECLRRYRKR